jgi:hypothetical protein
LATGEPRTPAQEDTVLNNFSKSTKPYGWISKQRTWSKTNRSYLSIDELKAPYKRYDGGALAKKVKRLNAVYAVEGAIDNLDRDKQLVAIVDIGRTKGYNFVAGRPL